MLNKASFAKSVVGLTSKFFGAEILLAFHWPLIILYMVLMLGVWYGMLGVWCWMHERANLIQFISKKDDVLY